MEKIESSRAMYKDSAERIRTARLAYEGTPVTLVIKPAIEGKPCILCGKTYGKGCKCGDE
jgi:hypothetical protein